MYRVPQCIITCSINERRICKIYCKNQCLFHSQRCIRPPSLTAHPSPPIDPCHCLKVSRVNKPKTVSRQHFSTVFWFRKPMMYFILFCKCFRQLFQPHSTVPHVSRGNLHQRRSRFRFRVSPSSDKWIVTQSTCFVVHVVPFVLEIFFGWWMM